MKKKLYIMLVALFMVGNIAAEESALSMCNFTISLVYSKYLLDLRSGFVSIV